MRALLLLLVATSSITAHAKGGTGTLGGRFQLIQISDMRRDQYLIDTDTGRIWNSVCALGDGANNCQAAVWQEMWVQNLPASKARHPAEAESK